MIFSVADYFDGAVKVITPIRFSDGRGFFSVAYREDEFKLLGIDDKFVQDNYSHSNANVLRGLHFQKAPSGMGKLMRVTRGAAFMVTVDLRPDSKSYLEWFGLNLSELNMRQIWAPAEFARGFYTYTDNCVVQYKCNAYFDAECDSAIRWDDPSIGVKWPCTNPILSERDQQAPWVKR